MESRDAIERRDLRLWCCTSWVIGSQFFSLKGVISRASPGRRVSAESPERKRASIPNPERMAQAAPAFGLSPSEKRMLDLITDHPMIPREHLATWLGVSEGRVSQMMHSLVNTWGLSGRLEVIKAELSDVRKRLEKLYEAIETSELTLEVLSPRIMSLRHREEQLEAAREDAETQLEQRRVELPDTEEIARYVADFRDFLKDGTIPERKALIRNFVEGIQVMGDEATLTYTVPMPSDGAMSESASVLDFVKSGPPEKARTGCGQRDRRPICCSGSPIRALPNRLPTSTSVFRYFFRYYCVAPMSTAAKLTASDRTDDDEFGDSVAVDGDTVVVGAHNNNAAYVFTRPATGWVNDTETLKLSGSGRSSFGRSVAIDGDTIVVGAIGQDDDRGSAFVFIKPATGWANSPGTEVANLTAYSRNKDDRFGRSVAIDGDTIVVGAYGNDSNRGSAHVFTKPDTGWASSPGTETAKLTASVRNAEDHFGQSVAVDGDTVVIGADGLNNDENPGSAYAFTKPESGGWADSTEAAKLTGSGTANGDRFGLSVAVAGVTVMVGANGQGSNSQGAAYLYDIAVWADIAGSTGETRSHFATGLTNGLEHTFAVRAVNDGGASGRSNQASETPAGAASLPIKPRNFSAVQTGADEVRLEWERSVQPLAVAGYRFIQDNTSSDDDVPAWTPISGSDSNTSSHNVTGLTEGDTYNFAIRAFNSQGDSDSSNSLSVTIVAAPAAPTGFTASAGDSHVELSWGNPGNSSITMYQYQQGANGAWTDIPGSGALTTSHLVSGLTNGTEYTFRVRAVNAAGEGAESQSETATPRRAGSRPARPDNFAPAQTGVHQVELTWDAASQPRVVTGYQFTQNGGSSWTNIDRSDSSTVSHTVSGLTERDTYTFAVRAINSSGVRTSDSISVTIVAKPSQPVGLGATAGDTQATVDWNQIVDTSDDTNDAPIDKY